MTYITSEKTLSRAPTLRRVGLSTMLTAWRTRQHLKGLDADALRDVGLSRAEAEAEAKRPFWDVPANWRD